MNIIASPLSTKINITSERYRHAIEIQRFICQAREEEPECWSHDDCVDFETPVACQMRGPLCGSIDGEIINNQGDFPTLSDFECEGRCIAYDICPVHPEAPIPNVDFQIGHQKPSALYCNLDQQLYLDNIHEKWICGIDNFLTHNLHFEYTKVWKRVRNISHIHSITA